MKPPKTLAIGFVIVVVALSATSAAAPCEISAEAICQLNGGGVHCQPCKPDTYVVCTRDEGYLQTCPAGQVWDAYAARCAASSPDVGSCIPGVNVLVPSDFFTGTAKANNETQQTADTDAAQNPQKQQSWAQWAAIGLSTAVDSAKDQLQSLARIVVPEQQQQSSSYPDPAFMLPLRMTMVYGTDSPTQVQLQQMRQGLARAASLQQDAMLLVHDAEVAERAAAQQMRAAHVLMSGDAESGGSSSTEAGDAAYQAGQLLRGAQAAQQAAAEMQDEAEVLLDAAASKAASVAMAISGVVEAPRSSSSSSIGDSQRFYGPAMLGAIFGTSAARSAERAAAAAAALKDEYYYEESDDSYNTYDSSFSYSGLYTDGDVDLYSYGDDDLMGRPAPPADFYEHGAAVAEPHVFGPIPAAAAALLGHLAEIHGEDAYSRPDQLHWAIGGGRGTLPPPAWPSTGPVIAMPPRFSSGSQHWLANKLFGDGPNDQAEQQSAYYYDDDVEDSPAAGPTSFSSSIIIGSALQDRLVKLAARAAAAAQQQLEAASSPPAIFTTTTTTSSSSSSSSETEVGAIAAILEHLGPLPMSMTVKREQEMLQLASFFDALYPKLSDEAASQLNDLDFSSPAVLDAVLVDGLPSLQVGQQLAGLMGPGDAAMLRSVLHAQMAELFADFVMLSSFDADYAQPELAASQQYDYAGLYDDASDFDDSDASKAQQGVTSASAGKAAKTVNEFKDAALMQQLDDAQLQIEAEQQQQQQQQQHEQGHKAVGLALPGLKRASTQQVL